MPITKIPVVQKFGIISSSQRLELQDRLRRQAFFGSNKGKKPSLFHRVPLDVTDEFVQLFNTTENFHEKEKYEGKAKKLLERAKRRSGVKNCGHGDYVNLPLAWTEMAQLAQCKGRVQEECLDLLVTTLDVSPLERYQIPALFYLAETVLYCLRMEELHYPYLRTAEIKLLKVGQLVFERLFYHHMIGQLQEHGESKKRLCTYIDGLEDLQNVYDLYPNALLYLRFVTEVGKIILMDSQTENADTNIDKLPGASEQNSQDTKDIYEYYSHVETRSSYSRAISSSVHDLSPTLWHALDVFRCTNSLGGGFREALGALESCGLDLASETWVDGVVAMQILGESAKTNIAALKVLHRLAQGVVATENLLTTLPLGSSRSRYPGVSGAAGVNKCFNKHEKVESTSPLQESKHNSDMSSGNKHVGDDDDEENEKAADLDNIVRLSGNAGPDEGDQSLHKPGFFGWHWEVAQTYTEVLENIVLFGNTTAIQKYALVGGSLDISHFHHHEQANIRSILLVDLAFFRPKTELLGGEKSQSDWSWRIRFAAMQSLARICHHLKGVRTREGVRSIAWSALLKANSKEKDCRVTEALKVSQMHIDSRSFLDSSLQEHPVSLGQHIGIGLSAAYLPPIPPPSTRTPRTRVPHRLQPTEDNPTVHAPAGTNPTVHAPAEANPTVDVPAEANPTVDVPAEANPTVDVPAEANPTVHAPAEANPTENRPLRLTLKQEIDIATALQEPIPDYTTRKNFDLRRIIDDQWQKELNARLEEEEKEQQKAMKERQQYEHERQKQLAASRQRKIKKTPPAPLLAEEERNIL